MQSFNMDRDYRWTEQGGREAAAKRAAQELKKWRGHFLAPASRKADRQRTYEAVVDGIIDAVADSEEIRDRILAQFFPEHKRPW